MLSLDRLLMANLLTMYYQPYRYPVPHLITDSNLFYQNYLDKLVFSTLHKMYLNDGTLQI